MSKLLLIGLTKREISDLMMGLRRGVDWSDVDDNADYHGKKSTQKEREFISRSVLLLAKLEARRKDFKEKA